METKPRFYSEEFVPMSQMIIGRFYSRVKYEQEHGDSYSVKKECVDWWFAVKSLNKLSIATNNDSGGKGTVHFSIATANEMMVVAKMIGSITGINPYDVEQEEKKRQEKEFNRMRLEGY